MSHNKNEMDSVFSEDSGSLYSKKSLDKNSVNLNNDHMAFFKKENILKDTRLHEKKFINQAKNQGVNTFLSQFDELKFDNPSDPVSSNNTSHKAGKYANVSRLEMERDLALKGNYSSFENNDDMTYGIVDEKNLVHNNMVPNFRSKTGMGYEYNTDVQKRLNDTKQRTMELFTGSTKALEYRPKTERRPLFNPQVGLTWIYGTPNFTNYMESRYIPSKERRNELIHQPVRTTPGLNLGYNEISTQGFNDTYRVLPLTVDELRVATNPKISYGQPIIPGMKGEGRRSIIPNVAKHRPIKFKEQDPRDFVKSLGYYRAPRIVGNYDAPSTGRQQTTKAWYGPANYNVDEAKPESLMEKYRLPMKENFLSATPINTTGVDRQKNTSLTANTYYAKQTNRVTTEVNGWTNPAKPEWAKGVAFDMQTNIPDPTIRNTTEQRNWNNAAKTEWSKGVAFDMQTNIPDPTVRNTTELKTWNNGAMPEWKKGYAWDAQTNIPDPTIRNTTEQKTWNNGATTEWKKGYAWDAQTNIPDPTIRNTTEIKSWNNMPAPEWKKGYAWDAQTNIPDPTIRNTTELVTQLNPVGSAEYDKGGYIAEQSGVHVPETLRQLTQNTTQYNPLGTSELNKGGYWVNVQNTTAPTTLRQTTQNMTQYNPVGTAERDKGGYMINVQNTIAPTTLRQTTQNMTQYNPLGTAERDKGAYWVNVQNTIAPTTLRQTTQHVTQYGPLGSAERDKGGYQVEVQNTIAPTTLRQTTQHVTQYNPLGTAEREKGGYIAELGGTIAPPTLRQLTQNKTYQSPIGPNDREKGGYQVEVQGTIAPTTLRQLTEKKTQYGALGPNDREKGGYQVEVQNTIAPTTLRQLTQNKTYQGPLTFHDKQKERVREDAKNSLVNVGKERVNIVRDGGAPTTSNYEVGPLHDFTMVQLCEPIEINRDVYGTAYGQKPLQCIPLMYTRQAPELPQWTEQYDPYVLQSLNTNPFINNTQNRSVEFKL